MDLIAGRIAFADFLHPLAPGDRIVVFCHFDADGLAAGALLGRALSRLGYGNVAVVSSGRGESAWSKQARARLAALDPAALIVTDLGVSSGVILPAVPTLFIDHHQPEGAPPGAFVISGYGWKPIPCSSWLAYDLLEPLLPLDDLLWLAAVGVLSDLGDRAPWPPLASVKKQVGARWLREAVSLVNAARRAPAFDVATALDLLMTASDPKQVSVASPETDRLRGYRAEVQLALTEARKQAPVFSATHPLALLTLDSACQIHPLIAQGWRTRLPKFAVIAANHGYLPGLVAFSTRTSRTDLNLPELFRSVDLGEATGTIGHGHVQAAGGHLPTALWPRLLDALGFPHEPG